MELTSISPNELLMGSVYLRLQERDGLEKVEGGQKDGERRRQREVVVDIWIKIKRISCLAFTNYISFIFTSVTA